MAKSMFDGLSPAELEALSGAFRQARRDCRAVMAARWHDRGAIDTYRRLVAEFQGNDPLFGKTRRVAELAAG